MSWKASLSYERKMRGQDKGDPYLCTRGAVIDECGRSVLDCHCFETPQCEPLHATVSLRSPEEVKQALTLAAAAPDMLAFAEYVKNTVHTGMTPDEVDEVLDQAHEAIFLATDYEAALERGQG
jgi:hypothetical protein